MEWLIPENENFHFKIIFATWKRMDLDIPENGKFHFKMGSAILKWEFPCCNGIVHFKMGFAIL